MFVMFLLGLQSHCKSALLLAQSSPPFQHHFCSGKTQVQHKEGKWKVYASLIGRQTALVGTHKYTAALQLKFAALFLSLRWKTLTTHAIEGETVCIIPSYSPLIRPRPALDTGKVSSYLRQCSSNAADEQHLPPAELQKGWMLPPATQRSRSIRGRILLVDPVAPARITSCHPLLSRPQSLV